MLESLFIAILVALLVWKYGPRRKKEPGFNYVYVNQDGSVRELSPGEKEYVSADYAAGDGARPYIKSNYRSSDGWGSQSGFMSRRKVPSRVRILPVNPDYDDLVKELEDDPLGSHRAAGDRIEHQEDGSILITPNPNISRREGFKLARDFMLAEQRKREALARLDPNPSPEQ